MKYKEKFELNKNFTKLTQKSGMSMIVPIVIIILIIILAVAFILIFGKKDKPADITKEAEFKADVKNFQDDLALSISNAGEREDKFNETDFDKIKKYIPSFIEKYEGKFAIVNDELRYIGEEEEEATWSKDLGVKKYVVVPKNWKSKIAEMTEDGVPIPIGFTYVTGTKETGTVIEDSIGNQFVWIPVTADIYVKDSKMSGVPPTGDDTLPIGITDETADVKKYGGFYIGRYEAGIPKGDTSPSNKIGVPVSVQGTTVWTNIDYNNAKASAESMISNEYVQTGLLTGKAWDTTCHWIGDVVDITDSRTYGNYHNSQPPANIEGYSSKQLSGYSDKWSAKNIYDFAGNASEWTSEISSAVRLYRSGSYSSNGASNPVSYRFSRSPSDALINVGFRTRLYIK